MSKIAIEPNLTPYKDYLTGKGYNVESISFNQQTPRNLHGYDAIIVTGLNSDFLGIENTETKAMVIKAEGKTPEDVENELKRII